MQEVGIEGGGVRACGVPQAYEAFEEPGEQVFFAGVEIDQDIRLVFC